MDKDKLFVARSLSVVSLGTLVSRVLGFFRDMVIADRFGASPYADAFFVAFRVPNLFRRFLGEGALTASFVPVLTRHVRRGGDVKEVMDSSFTLLFLSLLALVIGGVAFAPYIMRLIAPGFSHGGARFLVGVELLRVNFPYIFFISLVALSMGFLNTYGHFFAPAFAPSLLNVALIVSAVFLYKFFHPPIFALSFGVVLGGVLQLLFQLPFLKKVTGHLPSLTRKLSHPVVIESGKLMLPAFLGMAASQINVFVGTVLASFLPVGCVSYLYYADRLFQFPLGVFSIALGTVVLPLFSKAADSSAESLRNNLTFSLRFSFFISIPAAVGLILFRVPIVSSLFFRGRFGEEALYGTSLALMGYALGIPAFSAMKVIVPAFYSLKDTKTPFYVSVFSLLVNTGLGIALLGPLKHFGLALANSVSSWASAAILFALVVRKVGRLYLKEVMIDAFKALVASFPMAFISFWLVGLPLWVRSGFFLKKVSILFPAVFLSLALFVVLSRLFSSLSMREIEGFIRGRHGSL